MANITPQAKEAKFGNPSPRLYGYRIIDPDDDEKAGGIIEDRVQPHVDELLAAHGGLQFGRWVVDSADQFWSKFAERPGPRWLDQHLRDGDHLVVVVSRAAGCRPREFFRNV